VGNAAVSFCLSVAMAMRRVRMEKWINLEITENKNENYLTRVGRNGSVHFRLPLIIGVNFGA